jgi:hypothetical protein
MASYVVPKPTAKSVKFYEGGGLQPPKYMPTFYEWINQNGKRIIQGGSITVANDYGVYTVPVDYTLFLTSVYLDTNLGAAAQAVLFINPITSEKIIALNGARALSISYQIPIIIEQKKQIILSTLGNGLVQYGITGFLVKNSEIPQI